MGNLNVRLLRQTIATQGGSKIASRANAAIKLNFQVKKDEFLEAFDEHPVTQELVAGADDPQKATSSFMPKGNLFSLIGFPLNERPAEELREFLDKNIKISTNQKRTQVRGDKILVTTPVTYPTLEEVDTAMSEIVPLPWTTRSFTNLIQSGITGFGQFVAGLFRSPPSYSTGGLESKTKSAREINLRPIKYVNQLLLDFKNSITRGSNRGE